MCSCSLSLIRTSSRRMGSLAYIEGITDAYSQHLVNDIELPVKLAASAWSSLSYQITSAESCPTTSIFWCSSHLQGKQFQLLIIKQLISTSLFPFQNLSHHYFIGYLVFNLATVRNTIKHTIHGYFPKLQSNHFHQL